VLFLFASPLAMLLFRRNAVMMEGDILLDDDTEVPHAISLELFAKLSTGSASPEEVARVFLPHHLETCPSCRALHDRLQEIKGDLGYFDELVALLESETAPELARILESLPATEQLWAAETDESFHTWGLCVYLLQQSKEACLSDARRATELAILAVRIALALPRDSYHPDWVQDLQARAFAYLANALKVANELTAADLAFADAERRFSWQSPLAEAELLTIKSSLRREQRRYTEALEAAAAALKIYRDQGDRRGTLACHLLQAKAYEETQDWVSACEVLREAERESSPSDEPRLFAAVHNNLITCLVELGSYQEAMERLPRAKELLAVHGRDTDRLRLNWTEALLLDGLGRIEEAETTLRELQQEFLDRRMPLDATLVSLDLAVVLFKSEKAGALQSLAAELLPIFEARGLTTEAIVTYTLLQLQRAVEGRTFTLHLAAELAKRVRAEGRER
jgi:tetratricopeptide (TPR) repeat protein